MGVTVRLPDSQPVDDYALGAWVNPQWASVAIMVGISLLNAIYIIETWREKPDRDRIARIEKDMDRMHEKASEMANAIQAVIGKVEVHLAEARLLERRKNLH